ncbi:hypothetical protein NEFER03_0749 [Nematocida sp. LUAm3]|nr:hypothetical protein NEFER03_0749 [Nematocida sp. LUAm3]KAI5175208.1 hypothetical protein NEFER02_1169 [Nematocida sp. LUAm2]KAI5178120.1 hypothetical protein NEFER01_1298 [Nematocida sp. LUAm1]
MKAPKRKEDKEAERIKSLMIHSALFEMYCICKRGLIQEILRRIGPLYAFSLIEIANARICTKILQRKKALHKEDLVEVFRVCCILSRKFWNDTTRKNIEEVEHSKRAPLRRLNLLEREILKLLAYDVGMPWHEIQREIEIEVNVDVDYRRAIEGYSRMYPSIT